jgi:hypothetical protein
VITKLTPQGLVVNVDLSSITTGPDRKRWFTEKNANKIGHSTPP